MKVSKKHMPIAKMIIENPNYMIRAICERGQTQNYTSGIEDFLKLYNESFRYEVATQLNIDVPD